MNGNTYEEEVRQCEQFLRGKDGAQRYGNTKLYILPRMSKTEVERGNTNICPETNLNPEYHMPAQEMRRQYQNRKKNKRRWG